MITETLLDYIKNISKHGHHLPEEDIAKEEEYRKIAASICLLSEKEQMASIAYSSILFICFCKAANLDSTTILLIITILCSQLDNTGKPIEPTVEPNKED